MNYIERMIESQRIKDRFQEIQAKKARKKRKANPFKGMSIIAYKDGVMVGRYVNCTEAAKALGLIPRLVAYVAEGKRNHTGGYKFVKMKI